MDHHNTFGDDEPALKKARCVPEPIVSAQPVDKGRTSKIRKKAVSGAVVIEEHYRECIKLGIRAFPAVALSSEALTGGRSIYASVSWCLLHIHVRCLMVMFRMFESFWNTGPEMVYSHPALSEYKTRRFFGKLFSSL